MCKTLKQIYVKIQSWEVENHYNNHRIQFENFHSSYANFIVGHEKLVIWKLSKKIIYLFHPCGNWP
jgi:hypothetical protein